MSYQQQYTQPQGGYANQGPWNGPPTQVQGTYVENQPQWNPSHQQPFCCDHHRHNGGMCNGWNRPHHQGIIGAVVNGLINANNTNQGYYHHPHGHCCDQHYNHGGYCHGHHGGCCHHC